MNEMINTKNFFTLFYRWKQRIFHIESCQEGRYFSSRQIPWVFFLFISRDVYNVVSFFFSLKQNACRTQTDMKKTWNVRRVLHQKIATTNGRHKHLSFFGQKWRIYSVNCKVAHSFLSSATALQILSRQRRRKIRNIINFLHDFRCRSIFTRKHFLVFIASLSLILRILTYDVTHFSVFTNVFKCVIMIRIGKS